MAVIAGAVAGIVVAAAAVGALATLLISKHRQRQRTKEQGMQSAADVMPADTTQAMAGQMVAGYSVTPVTPALGCVADVGGVRTFPYRV